MTTSYDAIVIGAGQAGPSLAVRLAKAGLKTALIEREHLGGTCVNDGCIPTKTLVASARAVHPGVAFGRIDIEIDPALTLAGGPAPYHARDFTLVAAAVPVGYLGTVALWRPRNVADESVSTRGHN